MDKHWKEAEKRIKILSGGKPTPASGARRIKGDILTDRFIIEVKSTVNDFEMTIQSEWLDTTYRHSVNQCKEAVLAIVFGDFTTLFYYLEDIEYCTEDTDWSTIKITRESPPEELVRPHGIWRLKDSDWMRDIRDERS